VNPLSNENNVVSVKFNASRYGRFAHTLWFDKQVSEILAIQKAEEYLSKPLTKEYYNIVKDDLFHDAMEWNEAKHYYQCRGSLLSDAIYLERIIDKNNNGNIYLSTGS
jgi:hypothetical protein